MCHKHCRCRASSFTVVFVNVRKLEMKSSEWIKIASKSAFKWLQEGRQVERYFYFEAYCADVLRQRVWVSCCRFLFFFFLPVQY